MNDLPLRVRYVGGVPVVGVGPRAAGDPLPPGGLAELVRDHPAVVLDVAANDFLSSAFLGLLIRATQAGAGKLRVCCPPGGPREVFEITRLDRMIPMFDTLAEALAGLGPTG